MISDKRPEEDIVDFIKNPQAIMHDSDRRVEDIKASIDNGNLNIHPDFQRNQDLWDHGAKSRLIESILVGIAIPQIYTAEVIVENKVIEEVVDGQQRITSVLEFIEDGFNLNDLFFLKALSRKKFSGLSVMQQNQILGFRFHVVTLSAMADPELKFRLFEVLNRGSLALKTQEIRECMYHGPLVTFIRELAQTPVFEGFMKYSLTPATIKRKKPEELVAEFLAFYVDTPDTYTGKISFINKFYRNHANDEANFEKWRSMFTEVCLTIKQIFGETPFRLPVKLTMLDKRFNEAYYEMLMYTFSQIIDHRIARKYKADILKTTTNAIGSPEFQTLISGKNIQVNPTVAIFASSAANVKKRLQLFTNLIKEHVKESKVVLSPEDLERKREREKEELEASREH